MRINFYGGPGSGKSTTAARVFSELKVKGYSVEHCHEYVKRWVYMNRSVKQFDQIYLFAKQQQLEYSCLSGGVSHIVTDSPCFLSFYYGKKFFGNSRLPEALLALVKDYDAAYPAIHIFLERGNKPYKQEGRWQDYEEAQQVDRELYGQLMYHYPNTKIFGYEDKEGILKSITDEINNECPF